jgi:hypothetical protein
MQVWLVSTMCNLENKIISVERILQYLSLPEEAPLSISGNDLPHNWPFEGEIQLHNLHVNTLIPFPPAHPVILLGLCVACSEATFFSLVSNPKSRLMGKRIIRFSALPDEQKNRSITF